MIQQKKLVKVGTYRFTGRKLGKGNFAKVEEAVHNLLDVKVAVKIIDISQIKDNYVLKNLHREAKIMSQLRHPCIVSLFQTMQNGSVYYLVTELVAGGDLSTFIKSQKYSKLDERNANVYARQLISALAHMHNLGIVHRDLKTENIMVNAIRTQIKIVDFGLSNIYDPSNPLRTHCGSPEYAAPELFVPGKSYGPKVDIWSLGVILFGMVVGKLPFIALQENNVTSEERRNKLLVQINNGYCNVQRKMLSLVSQELRSLLARMLTADAVKRITINDLLHHSWVTNKGRKSVIVDPITRLEEDWKIRVMKQVGNLLRLEWQTVQYAVTAEPYGDIASTYNILLQKLYMGRLEGDGVTKTLPSKISNQLDFVNVKESEKAIVKKRIGRVKSPSLYNLQKVSTDSTPRSGILKQPPTIEKRPETSMGGYRSRKLRVSSSIKFNRERAILTADARNKMDLETNGVSKTPAWLNSRINCTEVNSKSLMDQLNTQHRSPPKLSKKIPVLLKTNANPVGSPNLKNGISVDDSSKAFLKKKTPELDFIGNYQNESANLNRNKNKSDTITTSKRIVSATSSSNTNRATKSVSPSSDQRNTSTKSRRVVTSQPLVNVDPRRHREGEIQKPRPYSTTSFKKLILI
ncbi:hypothetical protein FQR65_LT06809 [Abscondita terminalis]|nr:hypothetical protein FQR65_LT06809 [Abscondita terminalis]